MSGSFNTQPSGGIPPNPTITVKDSQFTVTDQTDTTKSFQFEVSGVTTGTQRSFTVPNASGTIPLLNLNQSWPSIQTFQDDGFIIRDNVDPTKTFAVDCAAISPGTLRTLIIPDSGGVLALLGFGQTWSGLQTYRDSTWRMQSAFDITKMFVFDASGITTGTTRTYTLPNASGNLTLSGSSQTWSGTQTFNDASFIIQNSVDNTKKFLFDGSAILPGGTRTLSIQDASGILAFLNVGQVWTINQTFRDNAFTLSDDADPTKLLIFQASGITTGTTRTLTAPNASGTVAITGPFATTDPQVTVLTTGSGTYTTPAGAKFIQVEGVGSGGGGAGSGTGAANGVAGAATTFGALTGNGGGAGAAAVAAAVAGGTATGGDVNLPGGNATGANGTVGTYGGFGGISFFGGAGPGGQSATAGASASTNSGSGGGGGGSNATANAGGGGSAGGYFRKLITSPNATYTYAIGAGGTPGAAGTGGFNGGSGADGLIIVTAYFQ